MTDDTERGVVRSVVAPAAVGAVVFGAGMAVFHAADDPATGCRAEGGLACVGTMATYLVYAVPLAAAAVWATLAFVVGAWRAPVITFGGAALSSYLLLVVKSVVFGGGMPPTLLAAVGGAAGFAAVAAVCLPGLRPATRMVSVGAMVSVAWWATAVT